MSTRERIFALVEAQAITDPQDLDAGPVLGIQVAGADGLIGYLVPLPGGRSDNDILDELHDFDPARYGADGRAPWVREPPWPRRTTAEPTG